jgi:hypothetical protein
MTVASVNINVIGHTVSICHLMVETSRGRPSSIGDTRIVHWGYPNPRGCRCNSSFTFTVVPAYQRIRANADSSALEIGADRASKQNAYLPSNKVKEHTVRQPTQLNIQSENDGFHRSYRRPCIFKPNLVLISPFLIFKSLNDVSVAYGILLV